MSYLQTIYNRDRTPVTDYPFQLVKYLFKRFSVAKGSKILELGIGRGEYLSIFKKEGMKCWGADRELIEKNKHKANIKKVDFSKNKLPFKNNFFDVVFHKSLIEHVSNPDLMMKETKRVLKKNGKLIILVPDWPSQMEVFFEDYTQVRPYDSLALSDLLKIHGFRNVVSEKFYQYPLYWKYSFLTIFAFVLRKIMSCPTARFLTDFTKIKLFRWSVELMVLGYGEK